MTRAMIRLRVTRAIIRICQKKKKKQRPKLRNQKPSDVSEYTPKPKTKARQVTRAKL